ncbi:N-6 DNA methylase [Synechococcus sp. CS-1325]|uniref:type ISP restriction/modification enzyme n=1 Tax=Synechococcus sp. CS-1325 TaxID=2847979 RepID=UPI00223A84E2|nr:type ISP restriction/modification enzyme [Synechococcus sp. CS-1325]MCT0199919.1 N-6 DNA methylase [Synechococcus sp. CS-1325]
MSRLLISKYQADVENIIRYGGSKNETSIRNAFERLLNEYCRSRSFILVPELEYRTQSGSTVYPDGTVKDAIRLDHGWWESKDEQDDLDKEIEAKLGNGYPSENILFEDSKTAVLIQHGSEIGRACFEDVDSLDRLICTFVDYERPEVKTFREAILKFRDDIPQILVALREIVQIQDPTNQEFVTKRDAFLAVARDSVNPEVTVDDVHEILIQHMLTEDIFINVFHDAQFHHDNNIARTISEIIQTFFTGDLKRNTFKNIEHYYSVIRRCSENISNHHEKQKFLKAVYENFYKAYNPNAADRLGIIYTPNEIVHFMIQSAEILVFKHFGKLLSDEGVEILDPCTGTGTFVTELIEFIPADKLALKYKSEIHCNEVAILPYYIANLNIEFTFQQKMGTYSEFKNICLVDTLDHCGFMGKQFDMFGMSVQNTERIQAQNDRKISVIIGNPPYYANQANENDDNSSRQYPAIDRLIHSSYVKHSNAKKTKRYDMYSRFFRWATDRLSDNGVLAFITNSNFLTSSEADGFRKALTEDFNEIYIVDLGGDVRSNPKLSGTKHNVFGIQAGVAISFLVKNGQLNERCKIHYVSTQEDLEASEKLKLIGSSTIERLPFTNIVPDSLNNWLHLRNLEFDSFLELANASTRRAKATKDESAMFKIIAIGVSTNRDEWVTDLDKDNLISKMRHFAKTYSDAVARESTLDHSIKWSSTLKSHAKRLRMEPYSKDRVIQYQYRPYVKRYLYCSDVYIDRKGSVLNFFSKRQAEENIIICITVHKQVPFTVQAVNSLFDAGLGSRGTFGIAMYRYDENGDRHDNLTDWSLNEVRSFYGSSAITKPQLFAYTYAVLHHPTYRKKFSIELQRTIPRLPLYADFLQWVTWGSSLLELHLSYETINPYVLQIESREQDGPILPRLIADKANGSIHIDTATSIHGIPNKAWEYMLANRSALEWILDQYKHKTFKDKTIACRFDAYSLARHKPELIGLLGRVCRVSIDTVQIVESMPA